MADSKRPDEAMVELKPCPFCGGKAEAILVRDGWTVECKQCFMQVGFDTTEEKAARAWNTRPAVSSLGDDEMVERVARAIEAETGYSGDIARRQARATIAAMTG